MGKTRTVRKSQRVTRPPHRYGRSDLPTECQRKPANKGMDPQLAQVENLSETNSDIRRIIREEITSALAAAAQPSSADDSKGKDPTEPSHSIPELTLSNHQENNALSTLRTVGARNLNIDTNTMYPEPYTPDVLYKTEVDRGAPTHNIEQNMAAPMVRPRAVSMSSTQTAISPSQLPPLTLHLPYVPLTLRAALADRGKFVDFATLHPDVLNIAATLDVDHSIVNKKGVTSFVVWSQCYSVFSAYRTYYFPDDAIPLTNYHRLIAARAELYKPEAWLGYDTAFRLRAADYPGFVNWGVPDPQLSSHYFEQQPHLMRPRCFGCGLKGYFKTDCPNCNGESKNKRQRGNSRTPENKASEICRKFNAGKCKTPCLNGRLHLCKHCYSPDHTGNQHEFFDPDLNSCTDWPIS